MSAILYTIFMITTVAFSLYTTYTRYIKRPAELGIDNWQQVNALANELGLTFSEQSTEDYNGGWLHGTYRDVTISVQDEAILHSSRNGSYITVTTLYEAFLGQEYILDGLEVVREELLSKVSKVFGAEDIQIGDEEFDKAFIVRADSKLDAQRLFAGADIRRTFLNLQKMCSNFHLKDGILTLTYQDGIFYKHNQMRGRIEALVLCARAIMDHKKNTPKQLSQPILTAQQKLSERAVAEPAEIKNTTVHW